MKELAKRFLVPEGRRLRKLRGGLTRGMLMDLDLRHQSQRFWGLDEREILKPLFKLMEGCETLVDVGANDGYYTLAFLRSSAKRVVACEPGQEALDLLLKNAEANGWKIDKRFSIETKPIGLGAGFVSICDLIRELPRPILLKVDIEGGEFALLQSAKRYPFLADVRWVIETHSKELEHQCLDWLQSRGYRTTIIENARWRTLLPERRPLQHNRWLTAEAFVASDDVALRSESAL